MPKYWLDASVFIQSYKGPYSFSLAPGFWSSLDKFAEAGVIRSPMEVHDELMEKLEAKDRLALWAKDRKDCLFTVADESVQARYAEINAHVRSSFDPVGAAKFMADADSWLIAHALAEGGSVVVTLEVPKGGIAVKIPRICQNFGIPSINHYQMLDALGVRFVVNGDA
jgi:predicted nucleic acid-binding protein